MIIGGDQWSRGVVSLPGEGTRRVGRRHETRRDRRWRSHGFGLRRPSRVEPSFPICVEPDTPARRVVKSRYMARQKPNRRAGHPLDARRTCTRRRRRRRFSFAVAINRTYVTFFPPFSYIGSAAPLSAIDSVTRATRLSGRILDCSFWCSNSVRISVHIFQSLINTNNYAKEKDLFNS